MRFGGHETFAIREGWLHKGLKLLGEAPEELANDTAQDRLGVGRNMVKSIRHWLLATGLAKRDRNSASKTAPVLGLAPLGHLVKKFDPYFLETGTWWFLHVNLVHNREHAYTWWWFFNYLNRDRFERAICTEAMRRYLQLNESKVPGIKTQQREVACLLSTYARHYPPLRTDPEDGAECPFIELGLLDHFRDSGTFRLNQTAIDTLPPEVLCYALAAKRNTTREPKNYVQIGIRQAATQECSAGRVLRMNPERLHEAALYVNGQLGDSNLSVITLAGEREIRLRSLEPLDWVEHFYLRLAGRESRAA